MLFYCLNSVCLFLFAIYYNFKHGKNHNIFIENLNTQFSNLLSVVRVCELTSVPVFLFFMWDTAVAWLDKWCWVRARDRSWTSQFGGGESQRGHCFQDFSGTQSCIIHLAQDKGPTKMLKAHNPSDSSLANPGKVSSHCHYVNHCLLSHSL